MAPSERAFYEAFFTWVYTPRAHADDTVDQIIDGGAGLHLPAVRRGLAAQVDACLVHDTADRLGRIAAPTLVISGGLDTILPPRFGRSVAGRIPGARFEVMAEESHQPFQEVADDWNAASMPSGAKPKARVRREAVLRGRAPARRPEPSPRPPTM